MRNKRTGIIVISCIILLLIISIVILHSLIGNYIRTSSGIASGPTVIVDAGHGGIDGGATGVDGIVEKDINIDIALKLLEILCFYGFNVIMTRTDDNLIFDSDADTIRKQKVSDIHNRFDIIENNPEALFISIHQNKYQDTRQWGTQVFYSGNDPQSEVLANSIQESVREKLQPDNNRRVKKSGTEIYLLYYAKSPAVMVECGFISNRGDAQKLKNDDYRMKTAALIADGIIKYTEMSEKNAGKS